jgi:hypothetical protein
MSLGTSVRIYDLAKDLKQDTKRVIEELRREGADVPSRTNNKTTAFKFCPFKFRTRCIWKIYRRITKTRLTDCLFHKRLSKI